jgi:hypothetical protein
MAVVTEVPRKTNRAIGVSSMVNVPTGGRKEVVEQNGGSNGR